MRKIVLGLCFLVLCSFSDIRLHPIKMTTCLITYEPDRNNLMVDLNFFADDFKAYLEELSEKKVNFKNLDLKSKKTILQYISTHFLIEINNEKRELVFSSSNFKNNVFHIEFIIPNTVYIKEITSIKITNTLLFKAFKDQSNLVRLDLEGTKDYYSFRFEDKNETFTKLF
ncbi:DUF6702 family protein [Pseudofulvibacter geojedonensis]|uniref:DUF6702 family protein n=1 Tax=Pseudofulvibacter geojedonensis TaxID=1123758 RepID=A0ABW3I1E0_9FLAO